MRGPSLGGVVTTTRTRRARIRLGYSFAALRPPGRRNRLCLSQSEVPSDPSAASMADARANPEGLAKSRSDSSCAEDDRGLAKRSPEDARSIVCFVHKHGFTLTFEGRDVYRCALEVGRSAERTDNLPPRGISGLDDRMIREIASTLERVIPHPMNFKPGSSKQFKRMQPMLFESDTESDEEGPPPAKRAAPATHCG